MATLDLSSKFGRDVLGMPMISRHLFCIGCNSSARYFGKILGMQIREVGVSGYNIS